MSRLLLYTLGFIFGVIFTISFYTNKLIDSIVPFFFFIASLALVFTKEELPEKGLGIPEIHYYRRSRLNTYGYIMAASLAIASLLFTILTLNLNFKPALIALILWTSMFLVAFFAAVYLNKNQLRNIVVDYITGKQSRALTKDEQNDLNKIVETLLKSAANDLGERAEIAQKLKSKLKIDTVLANKFINLFYEYVDNISDKIISDEVHEINKRD
jgi:ferric iron reductase protein FhuF